VNNARRLLCSWRKQSQEKISNSQKGGEGRKKDGMKTYNKMRKKERDHDAHRGRRRVRGTGRGVYLKKRVGRQASYD